MSALDRERWLAVVLALLAMALVAVLAHRKRPDRAATIAAVALLIGDAFWLHLHNVYEGPTVVGVGSHGIAIGDLGVPPSLAIAAAVLWRRLKG